MNQFNQCQTFFRYIFEIDEILVFISLNSICILAFNLLFLNYIVIRLVLLLLNLKRIKLEYIQHIYNAFGIKCLKAL